MERKKEVGGVGGKECERKGKEDMIGGKTTKNRGKKRDVKSPHLQRKSFQEDFMKHVKKTLHLIIYSITEASACRRKVNT